MTFETQCLFTHTTTVGCWNRFDSDQKDSVLIQETFGQKNLPDGRAVPVLVETRFTYADGTPAPLGPKDWVVPGPCCCTTPEVTVLPGPKCVSPAPRGVVGAWD